MSSFIDWNREGPEHVFFERHAKRQTRRRASRSTNNVTDYPSNVRFALEYVTPRSGANVKVVLHSDSFGQAIESAFRTLKGIAVVERQVIE